MDKWRNSNKFIFRITYQETLPLDPQSSKLLTFSDTKTSKLQESGTLGLLMQKEDQR